ncbi:bifunctional UDP-N-acetylmuramoyl-tripeptide:D-alanyl-D-alanine ligase/alanine racemase [Palleniella intestinalis]|jgi:alanine racemase|uniref:bifunctional UDP-N-acetylmuramoyl-tripeptide:D-alanyl-D-alanine ligase/alanine racemase n=1 Tax=Palleniella intestinalis TaxID=2736291 RepID=UPI001C12F660|nr:bifunctional UDP-N-acetylmuramoyl-tripeptide:D-alanyl-D-alanine ligase/alanine racemase [Palleniella intestinalis]
MYAISQITTLIGAHRYGTAETNIGFVLTDSRSLSFPEETLFFAIKTQRSDGHKYIPDLYNRGVRNFVVNREYDVPKDLPKSNFLVVTDTVEALQRLAERHREEYDIPVIGITGSNGKTTVKEWLYQLLFKDKRITRSPRSYNSQIGVPQSVWMINNQTELGIFEAGISQVGEMQALQEIIQPTIAVLTNIGQAHQENFRSVREKCEEKLHLMKDAKVVVYNADDATVSHCMRKSNFKGFRLGWSMENPDAPLYINNVETDDENHETRISYIYNDSAGDYCIKNINEGGIENSITCAAVCLYLGMSQKTLAERMPQLEAIAMRLEVKQGQRGCILINDSYNNDVKSLDIALDFMSRRPDSKGRSRTLILSDIYQTGLSDEELSAELLSLIKSRGVNKFIGIGKVLKDSFAPVLCGASNDILRAFFNTTDEFLKSETFGNLHDEVILIKGARIFEFDRITDRLELKVHETVLEVNLNAVVENYNRYRSFMHPETKLVCMVKADAYGAGAVEVAKTLQDHRVDYLAVAVADEGVTLRNAGITCNIMIMNPEMSAFKTMFDYNLEPEVYSFRMLDALVHAAQREGITNWPVHIKFDTGMCRLGFHPEKDIDELIDRLQHQKAVIPRSVFSHFVGSDNDDFDAFSAEQFALYDAGSRKLQAAFPHKILRHICNSAGIEHFPERQMDMCRLGLGLYGVNPRDNSILSTVSTLKTTILQIRQVPAGHSVGYSRRTILDRDSLIAAIPIGYADGLNRHLGNRHCYCLVNGKKADYVGNICMDVAMIDVTDIDCREGDSVEIFGDSLPVTVLSDVIGTIPYEILTGVSNRVKRVYFEE